MGGGMGTKGGGGLKRMFWEGWDQGIRWYARAGWADILSAAALVPLAAGFIYLVRTADRLDEMRLELARQTEIPAHAESRSDDGRERLQAFEANLAKYESIPETLESLFHLADEEGLRFQRGEYKIDPDRYGNFIRYRMVLPVKGHAQAIHRFMLAALQAHPSLALSAVQFRREEIGTADIEARVHWVLLTTKPGSPVSGSGGAP